MGKVGRPKSKDAKKHIITFRMNDDEYDSLKLYAQKCNMTISKFILLAIDEQCKLNARQR